MPYTLGRYLGRNWGPQTPEIMTRRTVMVEGSQGFLLQELQVTEDFLGAVGFPFVWVLLSGLGDLKWLC